MTRIHPRHHVRRRQRWTRLKTVQDHINHMFQRLTVLTGSGYAEAVRREDQLVKLHALIPSLSHEQVDALIDIIAAGASAVDMRVLARNTQIGQRL